LSERKRSLQRVGRNEMIEELSEEGDGEKERVIGVVSSVQGKKVAGNR